MNKKELEVYSAALILLQLLDGSLTYLGISWGFAAEGNPIVAWFISSLGLGLGLLFVKGCASAMLFYLPRLPEGKVSRLGVNLLTGAYLIVVGQWIAVFVEKLS